MDWIRIPCPRVVGPEWLRIPEKVRAAWITLMGHCGLKENGGRISGARQWTNGDWNRLGGCSGRTCLGLVEHKLATWSGDDFVLLDYPVEDETKTRRGRQQRSDAANSRWNRDADAESSDNPSSGGSAYATRNAEEKRREEKRREEIQIPDGGGGVGKLELLPNDPPRAAFDFDEVYRLYPRKEGKAKGLQICEREIRRPGDFAALKSAIQNYAAHVAGKDPKYTKHFSSFMACWKDYVGPAQPPPARPAQPSRVPSAGEFTDRGLELLERDARALGLVDAEGNAL